MDKAGAYGIQGRHLYTLKHKGLFYTWLAYTQIMEYTWEFNIEI